MRVVLENHLFQTVLDAVSCNLLDHMATLIAHHDALFVRLSTVIQNQSCCGESQRPQTQGTG